MYVPIFNKGVLKFLFHNFHLCPCLLRSTNPPLEQSRTRKTRPARAMQKRIRLPIHPETINRPPRLPLFKDSCLQQRLGRPADPIPGEQLASSFLDLRDPTRLEWHPPHKFNLPQSHHPWSQLRLQATMKRHLVASSRLCPRHKSPSPTKSNELFSPSSIRWLIPSQRNFKPWNNA